MTTLSGFDCWGLGPSPADARAAGRTFRTWYSSYDDSKDGPGDGPALYAEQGIWSICNFETTIDRVLTGGAAGGAQDMEHAINEYAPRGMPPGAAVILSADEAIPASAFGQALAYYQGARQAAAGQYLAGSYGEQALLAYLKQRGAIDIGWRSMSIAWPGGAATEQCDIIQTGSGTIGGVQVDYNTALTPFVGQWMPGRLAPQGDTVVLGDDDITTITNSVRDSILNRPLGEIDLSGKQTGTTITLGVSVARSRAVETELRAAIAAVPQAAVDPAAFAAALAGNPAFVGAIAKAVVAQLGADLQSASGT